MLTPKVVEMRRGSAHGRAVDVAAPTPFPYLVPRAADGHRPAASGGGAAGHLPLAA
jgi:hypothetical protein